MGLLTALALGTGTVALVSFFSKAAKTKTAGDSLQSVIKEVKYKGITNAGLNIFINFDVIFEHTNPTGSELIFNYIFLDIKTVDTVLAQIRDENLNKVVKPNGVTQHSIPVSTSLLNVGSSILALLKNGNTPDKIIIVGNIKVNDFVTEYNEVYPLKK